MINEDAKNCIEVIRAEKLRANSEDLRAALKLLAEELNSKETHFILELLQNAEDNEYGGREPELSLAVVPENLTGTAGADGCFLMVNNEVGFQPQNVRSLSSVGQSTKKQRLHGYIGEKGIGFKSVFRITASPHIFSNGFQFRFETPNETQELGYILPHWVERVPSVAKEGETTLLLPLLPGKRDLIAEQLLKIAPETVLFLKKLRSLNFGDGRTISRVGKFPFITLKNNGDESTYYVYVEEWTRPGDLAEEKRQGVLTREISVTFPLTKELAWKGKVFAFLPTEFNTGLPFLVNADFILNFNRERILEDRKWNQWLRDQIAPTFVKAFLAILLENEWKATACKFIPVEMELTTGSDFFLPVVKNINQMLRELPCILTDKGLPALPKDVVYPGSVARELVAEVPPDRFKVSFLAASWESEWQARLKPLGVESLKFVQLFALCKDTEWLKGRGLDWWEKLLELACNYKATANDIGDFPLLLCEDGAVRSITSGVFYSGVKQPDQKEFLPEWPPVLILNCELQKRLESKPAVFGWLASVAKMQKFSVVTYLTERLIPWMEAQSGDGASTLLVRATKFLAKHLSSFDEPGQQALANQLTWVLQGGSILPQKNRPQQELVKPECLELQAGWSLVFPNAEDRKHFCVLSDDYFADCNEEEKEEIAKLITICKAVSHPDPARRVDATGLVDWVCPAWLKQLNPEKEPTQMAKHSQALERWIAKFEAPYFSKFLVSRYEQRLHNYGTETKTSEFGECLRNRPWIRSSRGFVCPPHGFIDDPEVRSFLGESVAYVASELPVEKLEMLGVGVRLTAGVLVKLLRQMRDSGKSDKELAVRIYQRLQTMDFNIGMFREEPLILLTEPKVAWQKLNQVFWLDAGTVFDEDFAYAILTYEHDDLHGFFTKKLGMGEQPSAKEYSDVWLNLSQSTDVLNESVEAKLKRILPEVAKVMDTEPHPSWWPQFRNRVKVWTTSGRFEARSESFVPDDSNAENLFKDSAKIAWVPQDYSVPKINSLLRKIGCALLSAHVKSSALVTEPTQPGNYEKFLTQPSRELLVCWVCRFDGWSDRKALMESLLRTGEALTTQIVLEHSLDQEGIQVKKQEAAAYWDSGKSVLYLRMNAASKAQLAAVAGSIAEKFIKNNRTAVDAVYRLLSLEEEDAEWEIAERKWALSGPQQEWIKSLGIELKVLKVAEKETRRKVAGKPEGKIGTKTSGESTGSVGTGTAQTQNEAAKSGEQFAGHGSEATNDGAGTLAQRDSKAAAPSGQTKEALDEDSDEEKDPALKSSDTEVEFVHVSAHTRSIRRSRSKGQPSTATQGGEKTGLADTPQRTKQELEDRAVEIITRQFETNIDFAGYKLKDRRKDACGYDLLAKRPGSVLRIEIKAHGRESKSVFVTNKEWEESRLKDQLAREDRWELWNVENLTSESATTRITRYGTLPEDARSKEVGWWLDLSACSR